MWRIAWSFYAGAVGAWVITGPATYSPWAGVIGMVMYATCSGLPVLMIAYAGDLIQVHGRMGGGVGEVCVWWWWWWWWRW